MTPDVTVLVVEDDVINRTILTRQIEQLGYYCIPVADGDEALATLAITSVDLVLLDLMMPGTDGFGVLTAMKADQRLFWVPVIVISALDDQDAITRGIELGADDHLVKPWNIALLQARLTGVLARKRAYDRERAAQAALQAEQERSSRLLHQIFPAPTVARLLAGELMIADAIPEATVLFADMVGFTGLTEGLPAPTLVSVLNDVFSAFDRLTEEHGAETIKTQGDAYVATAGVPTPRPHHAEAVVSLGAAMQRELARLRRRTGLPLHMRIGVHSGPLVAGVIGLRKPTYDIWGDTVNLASRMESHGLPDRVQVSQATYRLARHRHAFSERGLITLKGKGDVLAYLLEPPPDAA